MGDYREVQLCHGHVPPDVPGVEDWLLMYLSGQSALDIASVAGVHPNAVHNRLRKFIRANPDVAATHAKSRSSSKGDSGSTPGRSFWLRRLDDVLAYKRQYGVLPHPRLQRREHARLGRWLEYQRRQGRRDRLHLYQVRLLDRLGDWRQTYRQTRDRTLFADRVVQLEDFVASRQKFPSYRAQDHLERKLGVWIHGRRIAARKGKLEAEQRDMLEAVAPGWMGTVCGEVAGANNLGLGLAQGT